MNDDKKFMLAALGLAARNIGITAPNPSVAAIIVKNGRVIGRGVTAAGGRPHAEEIAIRNSVSDVKSATMYVTLEPCAHHGKTPPCAEMLTKSGLSRVVIACTDPDSRVNGKGVKILERSGIQVKTGVLQEQAEELNAGFFSRVIKNRPFVTIKIASTIDGKISLKNGESKWISSEQAREFAHLLRAKNDAIMVGSGTVIKDDPMLDCRLKDLENHNPKRFILDTDLKIPLTAKIIKTANAQETFIISSSKNKEKIERLRKAGVKIISSETKNNVIDIKIALKKIAEEGVNNLLVEGGEKIITSLIKEKVFDRLIVITSGKIFGADARSFIGGLGIEKISAAKELRLEKTLTLESELVSFYKNIGD